MFQFFSNPRDLFELHLFRSGLLLLLLLLLLDCPVATLQEGRLEEKSEEKKKCVCSSTDSVLRRKKDSRGQTERRQRSRPSSKQKKILSFLTACYIRFLFSSFFVIRVLIRPSICPRLSQRVRIRSTHDDQVCRPMASEEIV